MTTKPTAVCFDPKRIAARFWPRVDKSAGPDKCWLWMGYTNPRSGYGQITYGWKPTTTHRIAWLLTHGSLPPAPAEICHTCDTPACVNPAHLWVGTHKQNMDDCIVKGRKNTPVGEAQGFAKLTKEKVAIIRTSPETTARLAVLLDMDNSVISRVRRRLRWTHLP